MAIRLIVLLFIAMMCTGCCTQKPVVVYHVKPFTLVKASPEYIFEQWSKIPLKLRKRGYAHGFWNPFTRTMYVPYGYDNQFDTDILMHEFRHLPEIDGNWHQ